MTYVDVFPGASGVTDREAPSVFGMRRIVAHSLAGVAISALALTAAHAQDTTPPAAEETAPPAASETAPATGTGMGTSGAEAPATPAPATTADTATPAPMPETAADAEAVPFEGQIIEQSPGTFAASTLIGAEVASADGSEIGKVEDLLLTQDDTLAGFVIAIGGFLGFGEKLVGIEADHVQRVDAGDGEMKVVVNFDPEALKQAPNFVSIEAQRDAAIMQQSTTPATTQ